MNTSNDLLFTSSSKPRKKARSMSRRGWTGFWVACCAPWKAAMAKCSSDTALRDIHELLACGLLRKLEGGGRSSGYALVRK